MKPYRFNQEKNKSLKEIRKISFERIIKAIKKGGVVAVIDHPNKVKFHGQKIYLVHIRDYIYAAPYVETKEELFLKTVYKSRKYTKKYLSVKTNYEKNKENKKIR